MRAYVALIAIAVSNAPEKYEEQRHLMVRQQIEARGIKAPGVIKAMRETPRHLFVPKDVRDYAYQDHPVPIGFGQTISQPYIVAFMTEALDVRKSHRILEIGTGSGYQAAILATLAADVDTIEIVASLAQSAAETLRNLGYANVHVRHGNGYRGWPENAPYDRIILTAAPAEVPQALVDQLARGGRLLAPVGRMPQDQEIVLVEKGTDGTISKRSLLPVRFVPMVKN